MSSLLREKSVAKTKWQMIEWITETIAWVQIAATPFLSGLITGLIICMIRPGRISIMVAILLSAAGMITGITWATRIWRREGTFVFISQLLSSPDIHDEKIILRNNEQPQGH